MSDQNQGQDERQAGQINMHWWYKCLVARNIMAPLQAEQEIAYTCN